MGGPPAPWGLEGEAILTWGAVARARSRKDPQVELRAGPVFLAAVRYTRSPVGPYLELAVAEPAWSGRHLGLRVTTIVVNSPRAQAAGTANWSLPQQLGTLTWREDGNRRQLRWEERGLTVAAAASSLSFAASLPLRLLQPVLDGNSMATGRLAGRIQPARVRLTVPRDDTLAPLVGWHAGGLFSSLHLALDEAKLLRPWRLPIPAVVPQGA